MTPEEVKGVQSRARLLHPKAEVEAVLDRMADEIREEMEGLCPILMCIMHGGLITTAGLASRLSFPLQFDYLHATRYRENTSGADLQWRVRPSLDLADRVVLLIADIFDEGHTLKQVRDHCFKENCRKVYSAVLIDKQHDRKVQDFAVDFVGLSVEDFYLYGYGMDYKGFLRNAPGIYAIDESDK